MANKLFYCAVIVILDIIAAAGAFSAMNSQNIEREYREAVKQAESYSEQGLCALAIDSYSRAAELNDSSDIRYKIAMMYDKGYINGEFGDLDGEKSTLNELIKKYPKEQPAYDSLAVLYDTAEEYKELAKVVEKAKSGGISSENIENAYQKVRHMYDEDTLDADELEIFGKLWRSTRYIYKDDAESMTPENRSELNRYCFYSDDGTVSERFERRSFSTPTVLYFGEGEENKHTYYFSNGCGNDTDTLEKNDEIYSAIYRDGVRTTYIDGDFESGYCFNSGFVSLLNKNDNKWYVYNYKGELSAGGFDSAGAFSDNVMFITENGKGRVVNTAFENVLGGEAYAVTSRGGLCSYNKRMFARSSENERYKMYDTETFTPTGFECDNADLFFDDGLAAFESGGKWGFVDISGNTVIEPQYEQARSFHNGYAAVKRDGKWGFINKNNEMIVEPAFEDAYYFIQKGRAFVYSEGAGFEKITLLYNEAVVSDDGK